MNLLPSPSKIQKIKKDQIFKRWEHSNAKMNWLKLNLSWKDLNLKAQIAQLKESKEVMLRITARIHQFRSEESWKHLLWKAECMRKMVNWVTKYVRPPKPLNNYSNSGKKWTKKGELTKALKAPHILQAKLLSPRAMNHFRSRQFRSRDRSRSLVSRQDNKKKMPHISAALHSRLQIKFHQIPNSVKRWNSIKRDLRKRAWLQPLQMLPSSDIEKSEIVTSANMNVQSVIFHRLQDPHFWRWRKTFKVKSRKK